MSHEFYARKHNSPTRRKTPGGKGRRDTHVPQLMILQQQVGNRAVQRLLGHRNIGAPPALDVISRQARPRTKEEAIALVPTHVEPKDCFVWYINSRVGWSPIPGTGCAHWVSHQLGFSSGATCDDDYSIRVRDVIAGKEQHPLAEAQVGDIWENPGDASHVGIVRAVEADARSGQVTRVQVEHDSSRSGGVVTSWFTTGDFYR